MTNAIEVQNISKSYGDFKAVESLSFEVKMGEIFALLGPNGAGKSTTIRMILDIMRPDMGEIRVLGKAITPALRDDIGYLPEERGLYKNARVQEMMVYLARLKGVSKPDAIRRSRELLESLDLGDHLKSKVSELSKGMQQKVQFAVTILHNPKLIIIDEPFSGLDPINRRVIKDLLMEFGRNGGAIVMSTHQMNQIEEMADRMLMISHGQQKLYGAVDEIREQFAEHALIVGGTGDWATIPGIVSVESNNGSRDTVLLHLADDVTNDDVLGYIARNDQMSLTRFERAVPGLDEIFIRVAGESAAKERLA